MGAIIGVAQGEEKTFELTLPDNLADRALRGVKVRCTVTVQEVFEQARRRGEGGVRAGAPPGGCCAEPAASFRPQVLVPLDDTLAGSLVPGCTTLAQARAQLAAAQTQIVGEATEGRIADAVLAAVAGIADVALPAGLVAETGREKYGEMLFEKQAAGQIDQKAIETMMNPALVNAWVRDNRARIELEVRSQMAVSQIAEEKGLAPTAEELAAGMAESKAQFEARRPSGLGAPSRGPQPGGGGARGAGALRAAVRPTACPLARLRRLARSLRRSGWRLRWRRRCRTGR